MFASDPHALGSRIPTFTLTTKPGETFKLPISEMLRTLRDTYTVVVPRGVEEGDLIEVPTAVKAKAYFARVPKGAKYMDTFDVAFSDLVPPEVTTKARTYSTPRRTHARPT